MTREATRDDDLLIDYSDNKAENTPSVLLSLTPTYSKEDFYAMLQYRYLGSRQANQPRCGTSDCCHSASCIFLDFDLQIII